MASIFDVAKYILESQGCLTTMKLQKLCYYAQAWSLAWEEQPIFDEDFQAWANGPVCPALYAYHRGKFAICADELPSASDASCLSEIQIDTIDRVLGFYGDKESYWLSELTHKEMPWREARARAQALPGDRCSEVITKESMQQYYSGL